MDLGLDEKVFIVTGAAKGIGEAITLELANEGAIPIIVGRSEQEALELEQKIIKKGGQCQVIIRELADKKNCQEVVELAVRKWNRIEGLVNNAGLNDGAGFEKGPEAFELSVRTNLFHYYYMAHYSLPWLKKSKGPIVNISSKTALTGQGGTSGYAASNGAQLALTREWAVELLSFGIRVNAVVPAEVMTPQYASWIKTFDNPGEKLESIRSKIPLGNRMTMPEEIAAMTLFLLSERSSHTTGQWIIVDGGYVHLDRA